MNRGPRWTHGLLKIALVGLTACGGNAEEGMDGGVVVDASPDGVDAPRMTGDCAAGGRSSSDHYLPMDVGNEWSYRVVDAFGGTPPTSKSQRIEEMFVPEGETEPVMLQVTQKSSGTAESWLRRQDDAVVRLRQMDFDQLGNLERTSYYLPTRLRLDERAEHLVLGATWTEDYIREVRDPAGVVTKQERMTDQWTVIGVDVECTAPWGKLECLHVERVRLAGGVSQKEYYFARGYGKIREVGGVVEELIGCNLQ